jgi:glycosyltransferase involved in cell wall biosynthesis
MTAPLELSIIVPLYDEAESLPILWKELDEALGMLPGPAEVIFVDDGSTDASAAVIRGLMARDARIRLVRLAVNAGLSAAFHAGLIRARGGIIVTMDSDLQSDPRDIQRLLARLEGADAVVGWRRRRQDPWLKRLSSRVANAIRVAVTGDRIRDSACSLRVMRRECVDAIPPFAGMHRFVPTLLRMGGHRVVEMPVNHRPRRFGYSKYGIRNRALVAFVDLLFVRWMLARVPRGVALEEREATAAEPQRAVGPTVPSPAAALKS